MVRASSATRLNVADLMIYAILIFLVIIMIYPMIYVLSLSISNPDAVSRGEVKLWPAGYTFDAYRFVFNDPRVLISYLYTIIYAVLGTFFSLLFTSMIAYPLSIRTFALRKSITLMLVITLYFSGGLIPYYMIVKSLHLIDTIWVMVLPGAVSAWNVIIYRTFFQGIPESLRESAHMDGANDLKILYSIILPLSKPLLATMALFSLVAIWNNYFDALMFLNSNGKYPLQMILRSMLIQVDMTNKESVGLLMTYTVNSRTVKAAMMVAVMLPIVCIYPLLQKYFTQGMLLGAVKG